MVAFVLAAIAVLLLLSAKPALAGETGTACIIDGQTLSVDGRRSYGKCRGGTEVRLFGIKAPGLEDTCPAPNGRRWQCGRASATMLLEVTKGRILDCRGKSEDKEGRLLATCFIEGQDLNKLVVRSGWALANLHHAFKYKPDEDLAARERKGLWQSPPGIAFDWRDR